MSNPTTSLASQITSNSSSSITGGLLFPNSSTDTAPSINSSIHLSSLSSRATQKKNIFSQFFSALYGRVVGIFSYVKDKLKHCFYCFRKQPAPVTATMPNFANLTPLQQTYWRLGGSKWKEAIDGRYHHLGPDVFDRGTHQGTIEPGYLQGVLNSFNFVNAHLGERITLDFYLDLHRVLCSHFRGEANGTLMGPEKVGVFRNSDDYISWNIRGNFQLRNEALQEYYDFELELRRRFNLDTNEVLGWLWYYTDPNNPDPRIVNQWENVPFGKFPPDDALVTMRYRTMSRAEVGRFMQFFIDDFYQEIERAQDDQDAKLTAIARFSKRVEWLHPTRDGSGRTDMAILNKVLTEHGFHPTFLAYPWFDITLPLAGWKAYLQEGLALWEQENPTPLPNNPIS